MKIKSTVLQVLAAGCFGAGLLYAMGIEGRAQLGGTITDGEFTTAMVPHQPAVHAGALRKGQAAGRRNLGA